MRALMAVFAWLAATKLRRPGTIVEDEEFSSLLWALSPPICAYLFFWTIGLSGARGAGAALARASSLPFLSAAVGKLVAPRVGAAVMLLATLYSAAACGRALAERRRRAGTERYAAAAPIYRSREEARDEPRCRSCIVFSSIATPVIRFSFAFSVVTLVFWFTPPEQGELEDLPALGEVFLGFLVLLAGPWLAHTGYQLLNLTFMWTDTDTLVVLVVPFGFLGWFLAAVSAGVLYGMVAAVFVLWAGALGVAGFFGYGLAVEAHYMELLEIRRREPRVAKDASGLLHGRDEEDSCSLY